jgi:hypothetical protein
MDDDGAGAAEPAADDYGAADDDDDDDDFDPWEAQRRQYEEAMRQVGGSVPTPCARVPACVRTRAWVCVRSRVRVRVRGVCESARLHYIYACCIPCRRRRCAKSA